MRLWLVIGLSAAMAGCGTPPPVAPGTKIAEAPDWAMAKVPPPAPIPENDGDPKVRRVWYAQELSEHAQCRDQATALQRYVRKIRE